MSWMRYRKKRCRAQCGSWVSLFSVSEAGSLWRATVRYTRGRLSLDSRTPASWNSTGTLPCRSNDWHQFCNTRWSDQFKREIRRIRCTLLIGRKHRLPVISQRREGGKNIAAEFSVSQIYWKKKKLHVLCHTIRDKFWVIGRRVEILTFIQLY